METSLVRCKGFTLLEITVSLTIFFIAINLIFSFFSGGLNLIKRDQNEIASHLYFFSLYHDLCSLSTRNDQSDFYKILKKNNKNTRSQSGLFFENSNRFFSPFSHHICEMIQKKNRRWLKVTIEDSMSQNHIFEKDI